MKPPTVDRRHFLAGGAAIAAGGIVAACSSGSQSSGASGASDVSSDQAASSSNAGAPAEPDYSKVSGHVVVLSTGGTIASTADASGALVPTVTGEQLVEPVYEKFSKDKLTVEVREIAQLDSSAMTLEDTDHIIAAVTKALGESEVTGVIVTHGTDSMEETAIAVDSFIDGDKPVVLTGAMRPFDDPKADGPGNLTLAMTAATDAANAGKGAFIAFGGTLIRARGAYKSHTEHEDGFSTNNGDKFERPKPLKVAPLKGQRVDIIAAYPGAPGDLVSSAVDRGAKGLVIEGMGAGNVGGDLADAIVAAAEKHIPIVMTTRVDAGPVSGTYGGAGGGATLESKGVIGAGPLRAGQSRILLAAALATGTDPKELFARGE